MYLVFDTIYNTYFCFFSWELKINPVFLHYCNLNVDEIRTQPCSFGIFQFNYNHRILQSLNDRLESVMAKSPKESAVYALSLLIQIHHDFADHASARMVGMADYYSALLVNSTS